MKLLSLHLNNFKSFSDGDVFFELELTTLVGENGSGKSSIGDGLNILAGAQNIDPQGVRYGATESSLNASFALTSEDIEKLLIRPIIDNLGSITITRADEVRRWLISQGEVVNLEVRTNRGRPTLSWGQLHFYSGFLHFGEILPPTTDIPLSSLMSSDGWKNFVEQSTKTNRYNVNDLVTKFCQAFRDQLIIVPDFRHRNNPGARTADLEALDGTALASTLLNLRTHAEDQEQARYETIVEIFHELFPQFEIQAIELQPGSGRPDVRFTAIDSGKRLSLSQVSAGQQETLALVTNLVSREGLIFFIEHPENHLHPHATRALNDLLIKAATNNQVIVATHSPYLVNPTRPLNLRRLQLIPGEGSQIHSILPENVDPGTPEGLKLAGQIATMLRLVESRESVFARAVLLVEDQSQYEFIRQVAMKIPFRLDSIGVSVVFTNGHNGFRTFLPVLEGLGIPFIVLRDLPWNNDAEYPPSRFVALDMELEEYLDQEGLGELRQKIIEEFGSGSKARTARILGGEIEPDQIPPKFVEIFQRVKSLFGDETENC